MLFLGKLKYKGFHLGWQCSRKSQRLSNKTPTSGMRSPLWNCQSGLSNRLPKLYRQLELNLVAFQVWKVSLYCWRNWISDIEPRELKLNLTWKPPNSALAFMVPKGVTQASKGEKQPILPSYDTYGSQQ